MELCVDESRWRLVPKFRAARGEKEDGSRALRLRFRGQREVWWCPQTKSKTSAWKFGIIVRKPQLEYDMAQKLSLFDVTLPVSAEARVRCGESHAQDNLVCPNNY